MCRPPGGSLLDFPGNDSRFYPHSNRRAMRCRDDAPAFVARKIAGKRGTRGRRYAHSVKRLRPHPGLLFLMAHSIRQAEQCARGKNRFANRPATKCCSRMDRATSHPDSVSSARHVAHGARAFGAVVFARRRFTAATNAHRGSHLCVGQSRLLKLLM